MRTQSIFDGGFITYPTIFRKAKPVFAQTLLTTKSFRLGPDRKRIGSVTNLKNNLGIKVGGVPTFKTPFISGKNKVLYNGYNFVLSVNNDIVSLKVITDGKPPLPLECWDLNEIAKALNCKNPKCTVIPKSYIADVITKGKLQVRFNVGVDKNHGTDWKLV
jgi:hypothetical protein